MGIFLKSKGAKRSNPVLVFDRGTCRRGLRDFLGFRGLLGRDEVDGDGNGFRQRER